MDRNLPHYDIATYYDDLRERLQNKDKLPSIFEVLDAIETSNHGTPTEKMLLIGDLRNPELLEHYGLETSYLDRENSRIEMHNTNGVSLKK